MGIWTACLFPVAGFIDLADSPASATALLVLCTGDPVSPPLHLARHTSHHDIAVLLLPLFSRIDTRLCPNPIFSGSAGTKPLLVGVATGMAWTTTGGEVLFVEATLMPGSGKVQTTGRLGDVMKESVAIALSWIRSNVSRVCGLLSVRSFPPSITQSHIHIQKQ